MMQAYVGRDVASGAKLEEVAIPTLADDSPFDMLVKIHAVATNPVDMKSLHFKGHSNPAVIGWDASGVVIAAGKQSHFKVGDDVYYAGNLFKPGCFAEYQVVDSRIAALKPTSLGHAEAAAFPLVSLTAWELLYEQMHIKQNKSILIYNGAGGVGSMAIQLAKRSGLKVIATASRPESVAWCKQLGADVVLNHKEDLEAQFKANGLAPVNYALNNYNMAAMEKIVPLMQFEGNIGCITPDGPIEQPVVMAMTMRRLTLTFEIMFSRSVMGYEQEKQGAILKTVADLIDGGSIKKISNQSFEGLKHISDAVKLQTSGTAIGKTTVAII